jgi:perosamine synthetase
MIPIYKPDISKYLLSAHDAINSEWISNHGEYVEKSTKKLSDLLGARVLLMANGTCATHCLFIALKFKYPDVKKIYVPNNCYVAAWNSVLSEYPKELCEVMKIDNNTWNTDTRYVDTFEKNAAVLIVHNVGNIINVPALKRRRPDLIFVEDACEGFTGKYENVYAGTGSCTLCSSISFYGNKIITSGEGGAFITHDDDVYNYIKKAYSQGMSDVRYVHDTFAYNYRMTNIQAAFLYDQLNDIDSIIEKKRIVFENYKKLTKNLKVSLFEIEAGTEPANWMFCVRMKSSKTIEEKVKFFYDNGVDIRPFFYPITSHKHLEMLPFDDQVSHDLNNEVIMIPSFPSISLDEQKKVVQVITEFTNTISITEIDENNIVALNQFIPTINSKHFRYFDKRSSCVIKNHAITLLFYDEINCVYFGYTHIDYDSNKYWFGIYLNEDYRGKGFGGLLLNYTLNHNKIKDISEIHVSVDIDNHHAIKLYQNNNFTIYKSTECVNYMKRSIFSSLTNTPS